MCWYVPFTSHAHTHYTSLLYLLLDGLTGVFLVGQSPCGSAASLATLIRIDEMKKKSCAVQSCCSLSPSRCVWGRVVKTLHLVRLPFSLSLPASASHTPNWFKLDWMCWCLSLPYKWTLRCLFVTLEITELQAEIHKEHTQKAEYGDSHGLSAFIISSELVCCNWSLHEWLSLALVETFFNKHTNVWLSDCFSFLPPETLHH